MWVSFLISVYDILLTYIILLADLLLLDRQTARRGCGISMQALGPCSARTTAASPAWPSTALSLSLMVGLRCEQYLMQCVLLPMLQGLYRYARADARGWAAVGSDGAIVWDASKGACLAFLQGHEAGMRWAAVAAEGTTLLTASADSEMRKWSLESAACLKTRPGLAWVFPSPKSIRAWFVRM